MNVTLINNHDNLKQAVPAGSSIVEYCADPDRKDLMSMQVYDPAANSIYEIAPDIPKISFIEIMNCIWKCGDV